MTAEEGVSMFLRMQTEDIETRRENANLEKKRKALTEQRVGLPNSVFRRIHQAPWVGSRACRVSAQMITTLEDIIVNAHRYKLLVRLSPSPRSSAIDL